MSVFTNKKRNKFKFLLFLVCDKISFIYISLHINNIFLHTHARAHAQLSEVKAKLKYIELYI